MKYILIFIVPVLLFSSCIKDKNSSGVSNTWQYENKKYYVQDAHHVIGFVGEGLVVTDDTVNTTHGIQFWFTTYPSANGTYKVVAFPQHNDEVSITVWEMNGTQYSSTNSTTPSSAIVRVANGKIIIGISNVSVVSQPFGTPPQMVSLTAAIAER